MDFYVQKAKLFALETAKKSQEIASQAARLSQELATETAKRSKELATETAKRSKELAVDVTKKADQLKAYAGDLTPSIANATPKLPGGPPLPSEAEFEEYGITPELREFVKGLTLKTFRDFPIDGPDGGFRTEPGSEQTAGEIKKQDLIPWQERHAVLVLLAVKEISDFRYFLCPRRMNETRFWKIYFTLVQSQISGAEARAVEKQVALAREEEIKLLSQRQEGDAKHDSRDFRPPPPYPGESGAKINEGADSSSANKNADDLDAYLLGALDSSDEGDNGDDDDGFDADFDQLVNSAVDTDGEDEALDVASSNDGTRANQSALSTTAKPLTASEISSDGELVDIPDSETEASRSSTSDKAS